MVGKWQKQLSFGKAKTLDVLVKQMPLQVDICKQTSGKYLGAN